MTNLNGSDQDAFYELIEADLCNFSAVTNLVWGQEFLNKIKKNLVEIVDTPAGESLKHNIINKLSTFDENYFPVLEALEDVGNLTSIIEYLKAVWIKHENVNIRSQAVRFIGHNAKDAMFLADLLKTEKNRTVRHEIVSEVTAMDDIRAVGPLFSIFETIACDPSKILVIQYFGRIRTIESARRLTMICENYSGVYANKIVEEAAYTQIKYMLMKFLEED